MKIKLTTRKIFFLFSLLPAVFLITSYVPVTLAAASTHSFSAGLTLFQSQEAAQNHCPNDEVVWEHPTRRLCLHGGSSGSRE